MILLNKYKALDLSKYDQIECSKEGEKYSIYAVKSFPTRWSTKYDEIISVTEEATVRCLIREIAEKWSKGTELFDLDAWLIERESFVNEARK